jgi:lipid II:glycine glycyltransferase (peptidoglycan interpeptide bridge formation enzyme)
VIPHSDYIIKKIDKERWLQLVHEYKDYNYRQSWEFGKACARRVGAISEHVTIEDNSQGIIGLADVRIKKLPVVGSGIAYINGGPLTLRNDTFDKNEFSKVIEALKSEYVLNRKFSLRIIPPYLEDDIKAHVSNILLTQGFKERRQERKTITIDLTQNLEDIRKKFHQKWRNCLNKAEKNNLIIRSGKDIAIFQKFIPLFQELILKKDFSVDLGIDLYANVQKISPDSEKFFITIAEVNGTPVAGHVASILGNTCVYLLGSANVIGRNLNAAYLLQWQAIANAKNAGCWWYDLGGIDPLENPGVYKFKQRMGGQERTLLSPYQINPTGMKASLTELGERMYSFLKPYLVRK